MNEKLRVPVNNVTAIFGIKNFSSPSSLHRLNSQIKSSFKFVVRLDGKKLFDDILSRQNQKVQESDDGWEEENCIQHSLGMLIRH